MKVLIVPSDVEEVVASARYLASRLVIAGIDAQVQDAHASECPIVSPDEIALVVPMGGDGTFLRAARLVDFAPVPLLPLNYGTLAFFSGNPERDEVELVCDALAGDIVLEHRSTADILIVQANGEPIERTALNEVAYTRGRSGRMVKYRYGVNGVTVAELSADGLIAATPSGSTGYALSAGGPIVSPAYTGLVVVPVAPHSLTSRAIVLAPSDVLEVGIESSRARDASMFVDGVALDVEQPVYMKVKRGDKEVLIARGGDDFFKTLSREFFDGPHPDIPER